MKFETLLAKKNSNKNLRVVFHILFWTLVTSSSYFLIKFSFDTFKDTPFAYLTPIRNTLGLIAVFYPLMYFVMPRFLNRRRWGFLILWTVILIFTYILVESAGEKLVFYYCSSCLEIAKSVNQSYVEVIQRDLVQNILFKSSNFQLYLQMFSGLILPIAIKTSLGYFQFYIKNLKLEKEKLNLELNLLKAQVNPHFLFNTLNNLYGLTLQNKNAKSIDLIKRLSEFLRYTLENANKKTILLSDEIELLQNYIALEKIRLNHTEVIFTTQIISERLELPPLIFIPLVENAFKYNTDLKSSTIDILLREENNQLYFQISNSFHKNDTSIRSNGIGIDNLIKRLKLHYGKNYTYDVTTRNSIYKVRLTLDPL